MSEFSDGYLLLGDEPAKVQQLIKQTRRFGLVLPAQGAWTPFFIDGELEAGGLANSVREDDAGILLHYAYAEDHGVRLTLLEAGRELSILDINPPLVPEVDAAETARECVRLGIVRTESLSSLQFPNEYEQRLRQTIRGILSVSDPSFDWEPYLARKKGQQRLG
jgi:hypothetical protein